VTVAVADHNQCGEAEPAAALDDLGHAVDRHDALDERGLLLAGAAIVAATATIIAAAAALTGAAGAALYSSHWY
jgi:hypothetical protein